MVSGSRVRSGHRFSSSLSTVSRWTRCSRATVASRSKDSGETSRWTARSPPAGSGVTTDQPLGTLAAYLLEPASEDGVVTWNLLDRELQPGQPYPILRTRQPLSGPSVLVP